MRQDLIKLPTPALKLLCSAGWLHICDPPVGLLCGIIGVSHRPNAPRPLQSRLWEHRNLCLCFPLVLTVSLTLFLLHREGALWKRHMCNYCSLLLGRSPACLHPASFGNFPFSIDILESEWCLGIISSHICVFLKLCIVFLCDLVPDINFREKKEILTKHNKIVLSLLSRIYTLGKYSYRNTYKYAKWSVYMWIFFHSIRLSGRDKHSSGHQWGRG